MAGTFIIGEKKTRPGAYFNVTKKDEGVAAEIISGVVAAVFKADFGPLMSVTELSAGEGYEGVFGNDMTTDTLKEAFNGGAITIYGVRLGSGGTAATVTLKSTDETPVDVVTITGKYPGTKPFSVTIREKLTDVTMKECVIYSGTTEFEKVEFEAGEHDASALVAAFSASENFTAVLASTAAAEKAVKLVSQSAFTAGTNPTTSNSDYSNAFSLLETYQFNSICVDTNDTSVHLLLYAFIKRVYETGLFTIGAVSEAATVAFATRLEHALAFNDYRMVYVLNSKLKEGNDTIEGYQTAARIAGMIAAIPANRSLTHSVLSGISKLGEQLTNSNIIKAEKGGCLVLTLNSDKQIWIDKAITTLVNPDEDHDNGWKKIRRVKTRFEMMYRMNTTADRLAGKVDNDSNGRKTIISQLKDVINAMISESKLVAGDVYEDPDYVSDGDECYFRIDVVDKDSAEIIYLRYQFQFSSIV